MEVEEICEWKHGKYEDVLPRRADRREVGSRGEWFIHLTVYRGEIVSAASIFHSADCERFVFPEDIPSPFHLPHYRRNRQ